MVPGDGRAGRIRFPRPLLPGDRIGVTAPSSGVDAGLRERLEFCLGWLRGRGYEVVLGECIGAGVVSAPAADRAAELTRMLIDPAIRAVVPPWGGELAVEILPLVDFEAVAAADPAWVVGYSDLSTLLVPLTLLTGVATVHGHNLMDSPNELPAEVSHWLAVVTAAQPGEIAQTATRRHRSAAAGHGNYRTHPQTSRYTLDEPGGWRLLDPGRGRVEASGRLIGGCIETLAPLAGSRFGDVATFAAECPEGTVVYVEAGEGPALDIARGLWSLRLAGWFDRANAVLVGRTHAPDSPGFSQEDAVRSALGDLAVPVVLDVDCGHVVPQLALINGAPVRVVVGEGEQSIRQPIGAALDRPAAGG